MKKYNFRINGTKYSVDVKSVSAQSATVMVNGVEYVAQIENDAVKSATPVAAAAPAPAATPAPAAAPATSAGGAATPFKSPLPGVVLEVLVKAGDSVKAGQKVLMLEAMKMENNIEADKSGIVESVNVKTGDSVLEGDVLLTIK